MKAVILAGGLGKRLRPFTQIIPKPLLPVGESSVLEIQIKSLKQQGFDEVFIATNYRSEYLAAFIGDGSQYGLSVKINREEKPLGTCGPVKLLQSQLKDPFLLMNGDILTTLDFTRVFQFGDEMGADLTVVTKELVTPFNFGKVVSDGNFITDVIEKPDLKLEILAGIYLLKPAALDLIPEDTYYGIDQLIKDMLGKRMKVAKFLIKDYWLDIGQEGDYQKAQDAYQEHFVGLGKTFE